MSDIPGITRRIAGADIKDSPESLRPKGSLSLPSLRDRSLWRISSRDSSSSQIPNPPPFLPPRKPYFRPREQSSTIEMPSGNTSSNGIPVPYNGGNLYSLDRVSRDGSVELSNCYSQRTASDRFDGHSSRHQGIEKGLSVHMQGSEPTREVEPCKGGEVPPMIRQSTFSSLRGSSLWAESKLAPKTLPTSHSDPSLPSNKIRPRTHPYTRFEVSRSSVPGDLPAFSLFVDDDLPPPPLSRTSTRSSQNFRSSKQKGPIARMSSFSSLDSLLRYRQERTDWKGSSSMLQHNIIDELAQTVDDLRGTKRSHGDAEKAAMLAVSTERPLSGMSVAGSTTERNKFRHFAAEVGFCFTIAMTQFLTEYLISGFAIELSNLMSKSGQNGGQSQSMGIFWPASLLSLILSATLLIFARLSDMYGGYCAFMLGVAWLAVWTLIPGFFTSMIVLDVARAMQGLAIAAFMPSTFAMVGSIYPEGPRRNFVLGLYSGCAPLGFFGGLFVAAALPEEKSRWYFWIASALSAITFITAFLTVPSDRIDRRKLHLKMDWIGSVLITSGLILVSYALSVEPYANKLQPGKSGFEVPIVLGPLISGIGLLAVAFWYEGWSAKCPLLPFDFFKPKMVKALALACLCFYATYGVWLYNSAEFFQSPMVITKSNGTGMSGISLALWYTPTAVGGLILCVVGGSLLHIVPTMLVLLVSGLAWIAAPLLLAFAPLPLSYWKYVFGSMLCATIGIELTFTVSIVFISSVQPLRYQGLSGALCSILVNLAISLSLSIS